MSPVLQPMLNAVGPRYSSFSFWKASFVICPAFRQTVMRPWRRIIWFRENLGTVKGGLLPINSFLFAVRVKTISVLLFLLPFAAALFVPSRDPSPFSPVTLSCFMALCFTVIRFGTAAAAADTTTTTILCRRGLTSECIGTNF